MFQSTPPCGGRVESMRVYRNKDAVEKCFDDMKNSHARHKTAADAHPPFRLRLRKIPPRTTTATRNRGIFYSETPLRGCSLQGEGELGELSELVSRLFPQKTYIPFSKDMGRVFQHFSSPLIKAFSGRLSRNERKHLTTH